MTARMIKPRPPWPVLPAGVVVTALTGIIVLELLIQLWPLGAWHALLLRGGQAAWMLGSVFWFGMGSRLGICRPDAAAMRIFALTAVTCTTLAALVFALPFDLIDRVAIPAGISSWQGLLLFLFVAPLAEELLFRGLLYGLLRQSLGIAMSVAISSICFALMHGLFSVPQLIGGIAFAVTYEYSRNLWVPVGLHIGANVSVWVITLLR